MRGKKPPEQEPIPVPLFPEFTTAEGHAISVAVIGGDEDEVEEIDGHFPPTTPAWELRKLLDEHIKADNFEGLSKNVGELQLEITLKGTKGKKREIVELATRELTLRASDPSGPPAGAPPTSPVETAPVQSLFTPRAPRTKGRVREHTVAPADAQIVPADVTGRAAVDMLVQRELRMFMSQQSNENQKTMADSTRLLTAAFSDGIRKIFSHAENRDERIVELKQMLAESKREREDDRAEYKRRQNEIEEEAFAAKRKARKEIDKLEDELADLRADFSKLEEDSSKAKEDMKQMLMGYAREFGPGALAFLADKLGLKPPVPPTVPAPTGTP